VLDDWDVQLAATLASNAIAALAILQQQQSRMVTLLDRLAGFG
jgi:hypothetical protein